MNGLPEWLIASLNARGLHDADGVRRAARLTRCDECRRPVLVGLVKSLGPVSGTHYEVVVGLRPDAEIAAIDPAQGLVRDELSTFAAEWAATRGVTLVVFRRDETPPPAAVIVP